MKHRCARSAAVLLAALAWSVTAAAQEPPDTLQVPDSLQVPADSVPELEDLFPDSVSADTIFHNLPAIDAHVPPGFATGVWQWDRIAIMASGANTIAELVAEVPGVIALWGGDYGTPLAISAFGQGGGGYRVFRDGFELYPLDGGVVDLQRVGLGGIQRVRLDRSLGAMKIELWSHRYDDGRPFSVVEAGTGDLDTNTFRGIFADPTTFGGSIAVAIERADTRGVGPTEGGNRTGSWVRYQLHAGDGAGVAVDYRRMGSQTRVEEYASSATRTDLTVRGRWRVVDGVVAEAYTGSSSLDVDATTVEHANFGGSRSQHGARLGLERGAVWATGAFRLFEGDLPGNSADVSAGLADARVGGVSGGFARTSWDGGSTSSGTLRGWVGPFAGLTLFGGLEGGTFGGRSGAVQDELSDVDPPFIRLPSTDTITVGVADRRTMRLGGSVALLGATFAGAILRVDSDVQLPLGTDLDDGSVSVLGADRTGFEGLASLPMPLDGLALVGSYQRWDEPGPYLPQQIYRAYFDYHKVHMDSGNLELWWELGVRGNDPMSVFVADDGQGGGPGLALVPFYQDWFARIQVRIVTMRLFFGWDNFTLRRDLQTFPERRLPYARSFFGLRWDMWN